MRCTKGCFKVPKNELFPKSQTLHKFDHEHCPPVVVNDNSQVNQRSFFIQYSPEMVLNSFFNNSSWQISTWVQQFFILALNQVSTSLQIRSWRDVYNNPQSKFMSLQGSFISIHDHSEDDSQTINESIQPFEYGSSLQLSWYIPSSLNAFDSVNSSPPEPEHLVFNICTFATGHLHFTFYIWSSPPFCKWDLIFLYHQFYILIHFSLLGHAFSPNFLSIGF